MGSISNLLTEDFAQKMCKILFEETGCSVNLINRHGVIVASTESEQAGTFHQLAKSMLEREIREVVVTEKDVELLGGVQTGINAMLVYKGLPVGVLEILGDPAMIRPYMGIAVKMTELWLQTRELINDLKRTNQTILEKDGTKSYGEISISLIRDLSNQPIGFRGIVRDITERKKVEQELRESEERYRNLVELSPDPIFVHDFGPIVYANPAGLKLLGASSLREIEGRQVLEFVHPDYRDIVLNRIRQIKEEGKPLDLIEEKLVRLDGKVIDVEVIALPISYGGKRATQLMIRDITQRKQAEKRLSKSEQYYKSLFDHNPDIVCSLDTNGCFISVNQAVERISGYSQEELLGLPFTSFITNEQVPMMLKYFELTKQGLSQNYEMTIIHKQGHQVTLDVTSIPIIVDNKIVGIYGIGKDITEHKRAQNSLEQLQYKNELILNSAGEGIFGLDMQGLITFCNPAAANMLGYKVEELIGTDAHATIHHRKVDGCQYNREECPIFQALSNGLSHHVTDEIFWRADGTFFPVDYVSTPIEEQGQIVGAVIIFKDITERKRTDEYIRKTEKLSVVGQLAAGVAHEIRNPLTALKGFVQLLQSEVGAYHDYFDVMLSEIDRMNSIVNEFLFLSKPQRIHFQPKDLRMILQNIIALLDTQAILYNIRILTNFPQDLPQVNCDENQLKQVFINILKNAIEAMQNGGEIVIKIQPLRSDQILVRIIDQGPGIPEDQLPKLGEPFYTTKENGTGLGLMVTYKIIEAHQGKIHITSQLHKGTTVDVILPVQQN